MASSIVQAGGNGPGSKPPLMARLKKAIGALAGASNPGGFSVPFSTYGGNWWTPYGTTGAYFAGSDIDWNKEAGDADANSIIMAIINFLAGAFPEAPLRVMQKAKGVQGDVEQEEHELVTLIDEPNPYYDGTVLWMSTLFSWNIDGNAYWIKWRNGNDEVVQLWYEPHFTIRPKWDRDDPNTFITGYEVKRDNKWIPIDARNVVHFRWMLDPLNPRKGMSPLKSALREIFTDKEGAAYSAITLRNLGWPGFVISPKYIEDEIEDDDAEKIKVDFEANYTKDNRGRPMVSPRAIDIQTFAWSPEQLNLKALRDMPVTRISALLRVPAEVTGLILDHKTYNNVSEAREQAYQSNIVPSYRLFAKTITRSFRDEYPNWQKGMYADFDTSGIRVLQEDYNRKATTIGLLFKNNVIMQDEARVATNFPELPKDEGKRFWFQIVATGAGGGGKDPNTGAPPAEGIDAADPSVPQAQDQATNPNPQPAKKALKGLEVLAAFNTQRRAYPAYLPDTIGRFELGPLYQNGNGATAVDEKMAANQPRSSDGRFAGTGHHADTRNPSGKAEDHLRGADYAGEEHLKKGLPNKPGSGASGLGDHENRVFAKVELNKAITDEIIGNEHLAKAVANVRTREEYGAQPFNKNKTKAEVDEAYRQHIETARGVVSEKVRRAVDQWAGNSGDTSAPSLAMQRAVSEEFGHPSSWKEIHARITKENGGKESTVIAQVDALHQAYGKENKAIARAIYNHTQRTLEAEGVTQMTLHRGMHFHTEDAPKWTNYGYRDNIHLQPISSFATHPGVAKSFSGESSTYETTHIITTVVPRERIFSTARTGFGCLNEHEVVILGTGKTPAKNTKVTYENGKNIKKWND